MDPASGDQPLYNEYKIVVTVNGEIYNHEELRKSLKSHEFRSSSDSEVIAHLFEENREQFVELLDGVFSFVVFDNADSNFIVARDAIGVTPLYIGWGQDVADVLMWRKKLLSAAFLSLATVIWVLFQYIQYSMVTLICQLLLVYVLVVFVYNNAVEFMSIAIFAPPPIPKISFTEEVIVKAATFLSVKANLFSDFLYDASSGRDGKKFVMVVAGLSILSVIGAWCSFLTLLYIGFVVSLTFPALYHKYEDKIDRFVDRASVEVKRPYVHISDKVNVAKKKLYIWFDDRVLRKILWRRVKAE